MHSIARRITDIAIIGKKNLAKGRGGSGVRERADADVNTEPLTASGIESRKKAMTAALAALDKKALEVEILQVGDLVHYTDYFVICSGTNTQQVDAIADNIEDELRKLGFKPMSVEGKRNAMWVLLDYGDLVVHVFDEENRQFYELGKLWLDAPRLEPQAD